MDKKLKHRFQAMIEKDSALRDLIGYLQQSFSVGDDIPSERDLEVEIGYSRAKLREALIRLECFGYIDIHHGKANVLLRPLDLEKNVFEGHLNSIKLTYSDDFKSTHIFLSTVPVFTATDQNNVYEHIKEFILTEDMGKVINVEYSIIANDIKLEDLPDLNIPLVDVYGLRNVK